MVPNQVCKINATRRTGLLRAACTLDSVMQTRPREREKKYEMNYLLLNNKVVGKLKIVRAARHTVASAHFSTRQLCTFEMVFHEMKNKMSNATPRIFTPLESSTEPIIFHVQQ